MRFSFRNPFVSSDERRPGGVLRFRFLVVLAGAGAASCAPSSPPVERPVAQVQRAQSIAPARLPPIHLMKPPRAPSCIAESPRPPVEKSPTVPGGQPPVKPGVAEAGSLARNVQVEFERDCYRVAEERARRQLRQLQAAIKAGARPGSN